MAEEQTAPKQESVSQVAGANFESTEELLRDYANNVMFEPSVWDLKMIFGQLDQQASPATVIQHTEMTIPWTTAKLMSHFLQVFLAVHESDNGKIRLPPSVLPPLPDQSPDLLKNPAAKALDDLVRQLHAGLIASSSL